MRTYGHALVCITLVYRERIATVLRRRLQPRHDAQERNRAWLRSDRAATKHGDAQTVPCPYLTIPYPYLTRTLPALYRTLTAPCPCLTRILQRLTLTLPAPYSCPPNLKGHQFERARI